jgi:rhodanese-related sulfurtransferase
MRDFALFVLDHWILSSAFVVILFLLVINEMKRKVLGYKDVPPADAVRLINREDALVLDVREENEFKSGHIINAVHIPVGLMESRINELESHRERAILVACRSGQRAAKAAVMLNRQGFSNVYKLAGGMMAWESASLPVEK